MELITIFYTLDLVKAIGRNGFNPIEHIKVKSLPHRLVSWMKLYLTTGKEIEHNSGNGCQVHILRRVQRKKVSVKKDIARDWKFDEEMRAYEELSVDVQ